MPTDPAVGRPDPGRAGRDPLPAAIPIKTDLGSTCGREGRGLAAAVLALCRTAGVELRGNRG
jgi:hypothetical protein